MHRKMLYVINAFVAKEKNNNIFSCIEFKDLTKKAYFPIEIIRLIYLDGNRILTHMFLASTQNHQNLN